MPAGSMIRRNAIESPLAVAGFIVKRREPGRVSMTSGSTDEFVFAAEFQRLKVSNVPSHRMGLDHPNSAIEYHVGLK